MDSSNGDRVKRISISLPREIFESLDRLVDGRGYQSRSQAISEMINQSLLEYREDVGSHVMAGTITLVYDESRPGLLQTLADIKRAHPSEILSSQEVMIEGNRVMEVAIVQGPASTLKAIADRFVTCKGVDYGRLTITSSLGSPGEVEVGMILGNG